MRYQPDDDEDEELSELPLLLELLSSTALAAGTGGFARAGAECLCIDAVLCGIYLETAGLAVPGSGGLSAADAFLIAAILYGTTFDTFTFPCFPSSRAVETSETEDLAK